MCVVSNVGDYWGKEFSEKWPQIPIPSDPIKPVIWPAEVSRAEFDALKREVEALKKLLQAAKEFDEKTGQPHCEMDEKVALIKKIAALVGVDMGDVFEESKKP